MTRAVRHHTRRGDSTTSGMLWRHSNGCGDRRKGGGHVRRFIIRSKVPISKIMSSNRLRIASDETATPREAIFDGVCRVL